MDMEQWTGSKLEKEYIKAVLLPCLFKLYAEYIMRNAGLDEAQTGIKIAGRNNNKLRYADDTTLMAESKEELKSLLIQVKEESEKTGLTLDIQKTKIMASSPNHFMENRLGNNGNSDRFYFWGLQNHCRWWNFSHEIKRRLLLGGKAMINLDSILKSRDTLLYWQMSI